MSLVTFLVIRDEIEIVLLEIGPDSIGDLEAFSRIVALHAGVENVIVGLGEKGVASFAHARVEGVTTIRITDSTARLHQGTD